MKAGKQVSCRPQPDYVATLHDDLESLGLPRVAKTLVCGCAWHVFILALHSSLQD